MYINSNDSIAFFLTVYIPHSDDERDIATDILEIANEQIDFCLYSEESEDENYLILHFNDDAFEESVFTTTDTVMTAIKKMSEILPECIFYLYSENKDNGQSNFTIVANKTSIQESRSIMIDTALPLIPKKQETVRFDCTLTNVEMKRLCEALRRAEHSLFDCLIGLFKRGCCKTNFRWPIKQSDKYKNAS